MIAAGNLDAGIEIGTGVHTVDELLELMKLPEDEFDADSDTLGGWTIESFGGRFPEPGESFRYGDVEVTVLSMDGRRVERVLVKRKSAGEET